VRRRLLGRPTTAGVCSSEEPPQQPPPLVTPEGPAEPWRCHPACWPGGRGAPPASGSEDAASPDRRSVLPARAAATGEGTAAPSAPR
jgi:hypothetical protein